MRVLVYYSDGRIAKHHLTNLEIEQWASTPTITWWQDKCPGNLPDLEDIIKIEVFFD